MSQSLHILLLVGEPLSIAQHHDAVSGTEKQEVAFDYAQRLSEGIDVAQVDSRSNMYLQFHIYWRIRSHPFR